VSGLRRVHLRCFSSTVIPCQGGAVCSICSSEVCLAEGPIRRIIEATMDVASTKTIRVLFVCMGNICRSPAAEIVLRHIVNAERLDDRIEIDSAGTIGYHNGNPPDKRMSATLRARGYQPKGRARQVCHEDFDDFDLILPMDYENEADLRSLQRDRQGRAEIRAFSSFCAANPLGHVPDPYYGGAAGFEMVADIVEDGCQGLLRHLRSLL
jgi:protein-tyrosine phosphatase